MKRVNAEVKAQIKKAVGDKVKVFPCIAENNAEYPYVIYRCTGFDVERTKDGIGSYLNKYEITVCADKFDDADALAEAVISFLDRYRSDVIKDSKLTGGGDPGYTDCYAQLLTFDIENV